MKIAHDVFSEINPAFCAYAIWAFTSAFESLKRQGPEIPIVYIALPIALSGDLTITFTGTNKKTGLLEWLERNPQTQIDLAKRVNASLGIVTDAIRFGCFTHVLAMDNRAHLKIGSQQLNRNNLTKLSIESASAIKRAERLGYWFAQAGSSRAVFDMMGFTV
jgi:hypothetical protein